MSDLETSEVKLDCRPADGVVEVALPGKQAVELGADDARQLAEDIQSKHREEMLNEESELDGLVADLEVAAEQIELYEEMNDGTR